MNNKTLDALKNWPAGVSFGDHTNEADELRRYRETGLTPEEIVNLNTFSGSQLEKLLAENATLKKTLELMYQDNKGYNHDGMGNPAYYIQKASDNNARQNNLRALCLGHIPRPETL